MLKNAGFSMIQKETVRQKTDRQADDAITSGAKVAIRYYNCNATYFLLERS